MSDLQSKEEELVAQFEMRWENLPSNLYPEAVKNLEHIRWLRTRLISSEAKLAELQQECADAGDQYEQTIAALKEGRETAFASGWNACNDYFGNKDTSRRVGEYYNERLAAFLSQKSEGK